MYIIDSSFTTQYNIYINSQVINHHIKIQNIKPSHTERNIFYQKIKKETKKKFNYLKKTIIKFKFFLWLMCLSVCGWVCVCVK